MALGDTRKVRAMGRPLYRIQYETLGCKAHALVNDYPTFETAGEIPLQSTVAINTWVNAGDNVLRIEIEPPADRQTLSTEDTYLRGKVTVGDMTLPQEERDEVTLLEFELDLARDEGEYPMVIEEAFRVPTPFPEWTWLGSPVLTVDDALIGEATDLVQRVWDALNRGDLDTVLGIQNLRIDEMARAMFRNRNDLATDVRDGLANLVDDPRCELQPLKLNEFQLRLFGNRRLVRVDDADGDPTIWYNFPESKVFAGVPLFLTRNKRGKLVWIR